MITALQVMIKAQMLLNQAAQQAAAGESNNEGRSKRRRSREEHGGAGGEEDDRSVSRRHLYHKNDPNKHQQRGDQGRHSVLL